VPSAHGSDQQEKWLKWYRMRLEELKAHEKWQERRLKQGSMEFDTFSSFHIKVGSWFCSICLYCILTALTTHLFYPCSGTNNCEENPPY
jgi:hypothetical protein